MSELGDYLRKARNIKGLSQAKVHAQIGITNSRICKAENGADNILSAAELKKLAVLYSVMHEIHNLQQFLCGQILKAVLQSSLQLSADYPLFQVEEYLNIVIS